jgi:diguanylate cyclase (GGDEF)-like protein/PAS domain S-box-containing protein
MKHFRFPVFSIRLGAVVVGAGAVAIAVTFALLAYQAMRVRERTDARVNHEVGEIIALEDARGAALSEGRNLATYYVLPTDEYAQGFVREAQLVDTALQQARQLSEASGDDEEIAQIDRVLAIHQEMYAAESNVLAALRRGDFTEAFRVGAERGLPGLSTEMFDVLEAAINDSHAQLTAAQEQDQQAGAHTARVLAVIVGIWIALTLAFIIAAFRWVVWPLERVSRASRAIAYGDLDARVPQTGPRELVCVGHDVNRMTEALIRRSEELNAYLSKNLEERTVELEDTNRALERSEARFRSLVQNASDLIVVAGPDTTLLYESPATGRVLGLDPDGLHNAKLADLIHGDDMAGFLAFTRSLMAGGDATMAEARFRHEDGSWRHLEIVGSDQRHNPAIGGLVFNMRDASERKALEAELRRQAFHDRLTGLANRASFSDRLEHAISRGARTGTSLAVLFLDLDKFKAVNDRLGHPAGDRLLEQTARRLLRCVRSGDTVGRFGGDEFAILLEDLAEVETAVETANRVLRALREPVLVGGVEVGARASIGIAFAPCRDAKADMLLRNADIALYVAKDRGRDRHEIYDEGMHSSMVERLDLLAELEGAVQRGEFILMYQPTICLKDRRMVGAEALVRWQHPRKGLLSPDEFVPLAEESGAILDLGRWVLSEACEQAREWEAHWSGDTPFSMSVNVSVRQLMQPGFVDDVRSVLEETGLDPACLVLEVTESVMMRDTGQVTRALQSLKGLGIRLAIDDFGTGYSSLSYLRQLPFDILKIDKSFVDAAQTREHDKQLERVIVELGKTLNLEIVAEGIEREDQLARLQGLTCDLGQGYLFGQPMPPWEMAHLIDEEAAAHEAA